MIISRKFFKSINSFAKIYSSGQSYVVFGTSGGFPPVLNLEDLNGSNGFMLNGIGTDAFGFSVAGAGDVNGDGVDDLIIGARTADPNGANSGQSYVVFGTSGGFPPVLEMFALDGSNGFMLNGIATDHEFGFSVAGAGDVNGDGVDDLIIGARAADPNGANSGQSYVVFGTSGGFPPVLNLEDLNGSNGFILNGVATGDQSRISLRNSSVAGAMDVNGDGIDDLLIGADGAPGGIGTGQSYVVFGTSGGFPPVLNLEDLNGSNGFILNGVAIGDHSGTSVAGAGDVNGDDIDDLIIGAPFANPNGLNNAGQSYVVFGTQADLSLIKVDSADPVQTGTGFSYILSVTNNGPTPATSVRVVDTLPTGVSFVSTSGIDWTCSEAGGIVTCDLSVRLDVGSAPDITVNVTAPATAGVLNNTATISSAVTDPDSGNNSDSAITTISTGADLAVSITDNVTSAAPGQSLTYRLYVRNKGPNADPSVSVVDNFPPDLSCSWTSTVLAGTMNGNTNGSGNLNDTLSMALPEFPWVPQHLVV